MSKSGNSDGKAPRAGAVMAEITKTVTDAVRANVSSGTEALRKSSGKRSVAEIIEIERDLVHDISRRNLEAALAIHDLVGKTVASLVHA